jgi:site-specific DNA-methyltransferase (adenine-specific)
LYRITKVGGILVWIVNDATIKGSETLSSSKQALYFQQIGFKLHDTMIWLKPSTPYPGRNRYGQVFEYMYILTKGEIKTFNPIKDRKNIYGGTNSGLRKTHRGRDGVSRRRKNAYTIPEYGPRHNVWEIPVTEKRETDHPATFPEKLVEGHILTWSNEGDLVYDCFLGSGTTAKVAKENNRRYLGSEISQEYFIDACKRIKSCKGSKHLKFPEQTSISASA